MPLSTTPRGHKRTHQERHTRRLAPRNGSYEFRTLGLGELGRELDDAFAAYQPAKQAFVQASQRWAKAVEELSDKRALIRTIS